jgi:hypothetical protein
MRRVGPLWKQRPNAATTFRDIRMCYLWMDYDGEIIAIEWIWRV